MSEQPIVNLAPNMQSMGGIARKKALSKERRIEISRNAGIARWGYKATHKGNFKEEFGINVECYVLNDENKTAVISQGSMGVVLGLGDSGTRLTRFVTNKTMKKYIWPELDEKIKNPIIFQSVRVNDNGQSLPHCQANGYDVTILIDICKAIIEAEASGDMDKTSNAVKQAHIIINASAKAGIKGLVYALAGFDRTREEIVNTFKLYVSEEAREYEKEFPSQLYKEWYRLYEIPKPEKNKPWKFMHLTRNQVYYPLANSMGKLQEILITQKKSTEDGYKKKLHQFLSQVGVKVLRRHLGQILGIAQISDTKEEYEKNLEKVFKCNSSIDS